MAALRWAAESQSPRQHIAQCYGTTREVCPPARREGFATVDPSTTNDVAWRPPRSLVIAGRVAQITRDPPTVTELTTTAGGASPIPGVPVAAVARLAFADERFTTITWHLQSRAPPSPSPSPNGSKAAAPAVAWREVGRGSEYVPDAADAGCRLFVHATPSDGIVSGALQRADAGVVAAAPARLPGEGRHSLTPAPLASPGLRVMTYNILADQYASSTYAKTTLFGYCAPAALEASGRAGEPCAMGWFDLHMFMCNCDTVSNPVSDTVS